MKHGMKHSHSPRHINAAKQAAAHARYAHCWWFAFLVFDFYMFMYCLKFKADKFDILNKWLRLFHVKHCPLFVVTFAISLSPHLSRHLF